MYLLVIFFPLISFFFSILFGNFIGKFGSIFICCLNLFFTLCLSFFIFYEIILSKTICVIDLGYWINVSFFSLHWGFLFDSITSIMLLVINTISFLVHIYSFSYMYNDPHIIRFFSFLSLFTFFMLMLVSADNFLQMFLGWEGVGLSSYLLISFWYTRFDAVKCSLKAIIVNRIGDFGIYLSLMLLFNVFFTLDYSIIFSICGFFSTSVYQIFNINFFSLDLICFFLFIGAIGKSAQLGLHTWLPDAMEGPTPVSALLHAATMVTAGVFIVIRCSSLFETSPQILYLMSFIGALTSFFASCIGLFQNDLKRIIAYSTTSQLGYMFFCCGVSNYSLSFFHLFNHAFFKALLFLSAGSIIHALNDEQDIRKMGNIFFLMPFTYCMFVIGSISLMGLPFFTGFYSKDVILEYSFSTFLANDLFTYWLGTLSAFFTSFYSFRLLYLVFYDNVKGLKLYYKKIHDASFIMIFCLFFLSLGSIFFGFIFKDLFIGFGTDAWQNSISNLHNNFSLYNSEFLSFELKIIPILFSILGGFLSLIIYHFFYEIFFNYFFFSNFYNFFNQKWFFDLIYNYFFVYFFFLFSYNISLKTIDRGILEIFSSLFFIRFFSNFLRNFLKIQSGFLYHYCFIIFIYIFFLLFLFNYFFIFYISSELFIILFFSFIIFYITINE